MEYVCCDGGRVGAGYKGTAGDCFVRAIAIATGEPYQDVYDEINALAADERPRSRKRSSSRTGVWPHTAKRYLWARGWEWTPTMHIGSGCKVHMRADELPSGPLIVRLSKHVAAVIDGTVFDTHDPRRDGTRCVYGYFSPTKGDTNE